MEFTVYICSSVKMTTNKTMESAMNGSVFELVINAGEAFVDVFMQHLSGIFAHSKEEITEVLEKIESVNKLLLLRAQLFEKLQNIIPNLINREMYARRKLRLIAEDIYVIGFSLVSGLEHVLIRSRILKPSQGNESTLTHSQEDVPEEPNIAHLIEMCSSLKLTVEQLHFKVNKLSNKVEILEGENSSLKISIKRLSQQTSVDEPSLMEESETQIKGSDVNAISVPSSSLPDETLLKTPFSTGVEIPTAPVVLKPKSGNTSSSLAIGISSVSPMKNMITESVVASPKAIQQQENKQVSNNIINQSKEKSRIFRMQSSLSTQVGSAHKTIPIYIGKLCQTTDEDTLLAHLQDIGINLGDISEIKKLTPSGSKEVSYCVSLNSETVANLVKLMDNWPKEDPFLLDMEMANLIALLV